MQNIQITNLSVDELREIILDTIRKEVVQKFPQPKKENLYLKRQETANILGISLTTLNEWTKRGILKGYRIGNSTIRYKSNEVGDALEEIQTIKFKRGGRNE